MAPKRSDKELAETGDFIQRLYEAGGYATWAEFARDAQVHAVQLSNWQNGASGLDGHNLLRLIQAVAARTQAPETTVAVRAAGGPQVQVVSLLQGLAAAADQSGEAAQQLLAGQTELRDRLERLEAAAAAAAAQPRRRRREASE